MLTQFVTLMPTCEARFAKSTLMRITDFLKKRRHVKDKCINLMLLFQKVHGKHPQSRTTGSFC